MSGPEHIVYLDHNATTAVSLTVFEAMKPFFTDCFENPSSPYPEGERARSSVVAARERVATLLGAKTAEIVFTGGGTESNHAAILSHLREKAPRTGIVASGIEHPSVMKLLKDLSAKGYEVRFVNPGKDGTVPVEGIREALSDQTALVVLMWANNETGVLQPVEAVARLARECGAAFHTDAVAALGKVAIDLSRVMADTLSLSAHKIHGPKGVGALFVRKGLSFSPLLFGSQERGRRGSTENVPGIVGLGQAASDVYEERARSGERMSSLRDRLERGISGLFAPGFVASNGEGTRVPNVTNLRFSGQSGEKLLDRLIKKGIRASIGSACSSGSMEPSHVLLAMGLSKDEALSSLRFSLGSGTTPGDIDRALSAFREIASEEGLPVREDAVVSV